MMGRKQILIVSSKRAKRNRIKKLKASQTHLTPWEGNEQIILETTSKHNKEVNMDLQKGKLCLINLLAFYDEMTGLVDNGRAVNVGYLDCSKAFEIVSHKTLTDRGRTS